jgi:serine/threonine protein kinase
MNNGNAELIDHARGIMIDSVGLKLGNYRLVRMVGHGGFADVYLAEHVYLKTEAAIKMLHARLPSKLLQNFLVEARNHAQLHHPNIVQVLDFGIEDNIPFLVMNYAHRGTLRQRHPTGSILEPATIVFYVKQVASALHYAHNRHIIHRDIKPENMLLSHEGIIMLSDFGIAIALRNFQNMSKPTVLSVGTMIAGTTTYMAPEQFSGTPYYTSDQYALAAVVYEWFCGTPPFSGSDFQVAIKHMYRQPMPMRELMPALAPAIDRVVMKALEKNPQQRFATIQHFADALEAACTRVPAPLPSRPYPVTRPLGPAPIAVRNTNLSPRNQWVSAVDVMQERTSQLLVDRHLPFSKTLSATLQPEQRTLMSFRQVAVVPMQSQSMVLQRTTLPAPAAGKQPKNSPPMSERKKMWLLALTIFCLSSLITLSFISFIQANFHTQKPQIHPIATSVPQKTNTTIVPMSPLSSPVVKHSSASKAAKSTLNQIKPVPTAIPVIPTTVPTAPPAKILLVTPSSLTPGACMPDNSAYRCTIRLALDPTYTSQLFWQASSIHISTFFNHKQGTLSPGQSQQIIIYVSRQCSAGSSFVFSGAGTNTYIPWNC